jgi:hypothetical protein
MDGLLLLAAEILIIGISVWVVVTETKSPEEISRRLDLAPKPPRKPRFPELAAAVTKPVSRSSRREIHH